MNWTRIMMREWFGGSGLVWWIAGLAVVGGTSACGGSGGSGMGSTPAGSTDLRVVGSTPASAASDVDPAIQVSVQFDRLIDASTVTSTTFSVWTTVALAGGLQVAGDSVLFTPDNPLDLFATHSVRLTEGIRSTAGDRLPAASKILFRTRDGNWAAPVSLPTNATMTGLASAADGSTVALRFRSATPWSDLIVTHISPGATWAPEATLFGDGSAAFARIALDPTGWGVAVARRSAGGNSFATSTRERSSDGQWSAAIDAAPLDSGFGEPQLAILENGRAVLAWRRNASSEVCVTVLAAGGIWAPVLRLSGDGVDADSPVLATDGLGSALVVWREDAQRLHAARYSVASGWSVAQLVHTEFVCCVSAPGATLVSGGRGLVAFEASGTVFAASYQPTTGVWGAAETVSGIGCAGTLARIGVESNEQGRSVVTWHCDRTVWAATAEPGAAWSAPLMLGETGATADSVTSIDRNGNATVMWSHEPTPGAPRHIVYRRRTPNQAWGPQILISSPTRCAVAPRIAPLPSGGMRAVWTYTINCDFNQGRGSEGALFE
ncbi:MAG: hypothetical protein ACI8QZ_000185 [Chlamydiales bacterium]|jgi:hypothetical protein